MDDAVKKVLTDILNEISVEDFASEDGEDIASDILGYLSNAGYVIVRAEVK